MRILLANDDGIHSEGFAVLEDIARELSDEIWCVAPEADRSGLAHSLTQLEPLRLRKLAARRYALRGTPADCVIVAIRELMSAPPDLILSGVNSGVNIADDINYSGTIGATIEGALFGIPSIALSQHYDIVDGERSFNWEISRSQAPGLIRRLLDLPHVDGTFYNINFPHCRLEDLQPPRVVEQGRRAHGYQVDRRLDGRDFPYFWLRASHEKTDYLPGSDAEAMAHNAPSITALKIDMTDHTQNARLKNLDFAG
ncbi:5'/3'-nucleotidase SurE [Paracoccus sp. P2]|uniref:5'/3'-nucleotidase SurE n=1 Tax=Paracoccus sp. P2 TaxID=3248840 RepID=UPI00391F37F8